MTLATRKLIRRQFEEQMIGKWVGEKVLRTRIEETLTDEHLDEVSESEIVVDAIVLPITEKDRQIIDMGDVRLGDAHGFFKEADDIREKDYITSQTSRRKYQIVKIDDEARVHGLDCFLHFYMAYRETLS